MLPCLNRSEPFPGLWTKSSILPGARKLSSDTAGLCLPLLQTEPCLWPLHVLSSPPAPSLALHGASLSHLQLPAKGSFIHRPTPSPPAAGAVTGPGVTARNSTDGPLPFWSFQSKERRCHGSQSTSTGTHGGPRGTEGPVEGRGRHTCQATDHPHCPHQRAFRVMLVISERPTSSRVSKLTSNNPMVGGRASKRTCIGCTSPGRQWGPSSRPLAFLLQPVSEKACVVCDSGRPRRISPGTPGRAPSSPLSP